MEDILPADRPVENWKTFSPSDPWQKLKQAPAFAGIAARANYLEVLYGKQENSIVRKNIRIYYF